MTQPTHPFTLLADPVRRRIVEVLAVGEHSAGTLCDVAMTEFGISRTAVSHHLRVLRDPAPRRRRLIHRVSGSIPVDTRGLHGRTRVSRSLVSTPPHMRQHRLVRGPGGAGQWLGLVRLM